MGIGGGLLVATLQGALSPYSLWGYSTWLTGGVAFLLIGVGLQEPLLNVAEQSRKRSDQASGRLFLLQSLPSPAVHSNGHRSDVLAERIIPLFKA